MNDGFGGYSPPKWILDAISFTTADLSQAFGVPTSTIRRWATEEHWETTVIDGKARYLGDDIERLRERMRRRIEAEDRRRGA